MLQIDELMETRREADGEHLGQRAKVLRTVGEMLKEEPLESISVSKICKRVDISRPTFYRMFTDKYDVYNWYLRVSLRSNIAQIGTVFPWNEALVRFFRVMDANRELSIPFFRASDERGPRRQLVAYIVNLLGKAVLARLPEASELPYRYEFQILAFARAFSAALADWLSETDPPYSMVDSVLSIVPHELHEMLDRDAEGNELKVTNARLTDTAVVIEFVSENIFPI